MDTVTHVADLLPPLPMPPRRQGSGRRTRPWPWERCSGQTLDRPTPLDTDLMRAIEYFGVANAHHLAALIGGNVDWIERRLHLLYDTEYLERPDPQFTGLTPGDDNRRFRFKGWQTALAYTLWPRGAEHLARLDDKSAPAIMKRVPTWEHFHHELETTDLIVGIELCCRHAQSSIYVPTEAFFPDERPHRGVQLAAGGRRTTTDWGPFAIDRGVDRIPLILERDRRTEPKHRYSDQLQTYIAKKIECYEAVRDVWRQDPGSSPIGSGEFVVLFATTATERRDALARVAREVAGGNADLYWFTDNDAIARHNVIDPRAPERNSVLSMPWKTGKDETQTLLQE